MWNSRRNLNAENRCQYHRETYHCPADPSALKMTSYVAITGAETAWPVPAVGRLQDFSKGASNVILVVENSDSGIFWMEPRDLEFTRLDFTVHSRWRFDFQSRRRGAVQAISSEHWEGADVLLADGLVRCFAANTSPDLLKDMMIVSGSPASQQTAAP